MGNSVFRIEISIRYGAWREAGKRYYPRDECDTKMLREHPDEFVGWCYLVKEHFIEKQPDGNQWVPVTGWIGVFKTFSEAATEANAFAVEEN